MHSAEGYFMGCSLHTAVTHLEEKMEGKSRKQVKIQPFAKVPRIQVPPCFRNMSLLKDLQPGQRRYLYSIMCVYDRAAGRDLLYQQYQFKLQWEGMLGYLTTEEVAHSMLQLNHSRKDPKSKRAMDLHANAPVSEKSRKAASQHQKNTKVHPK
uniref:Protein FAM216B n=1 Tax=Geotrypetes seraphini TaxID=260995 RepID=A0A6P8PL91_GEOSA|nr:protein FAM216B [Geotrypetes seraphini]